MDLKTRLEFVQQFSEERMKRQYAELIEELPMLSYVDLSEVCACVLG